MSQEQMIVQIQKLQKSFNDGKSFALNTLDLQIPPGKIIGLLGPDGAGKTTLIRLMAGLLKPTHGDIQILGNDTIKNAHAIYDLIGYMPQKFGLYEDLTVMQNLNLYAKLQSLSKEEKEKKFEYLLEFTQLKPFTNRLAKNLSGGMKQKLGLACTLLRTPRLLLLDEPSVGIDPLSRRELWKMVSSLSDENISIIWSTAYLDEAEKCDDAIILNEGNLLYYGASKELTEKLKDRTFLLSNNDIDKRTTLSEALKTNQLIDGVIQGNSVRLVIKKDSNPENIQKIVNGEIIATPPRFEDAFMDILGGVTNVESPLTQLNAEKKENKSFW